MALERNSRTWREATINVLRHYKQELMADFEDYLVVCQHSPNTRKVYCDLVKTALLRCDLRIEAEYDVYISQYSGSTKYTRRTARNAFMRFINQDLIATGQQPVNTPTGPTKHSKEARTKEIYKRKQEAFERAARDVLQGIEEGHITATIEQMINNGRQMLDISKRFAKQQNRPLEPSEHIVDVDKMNDSDHDYLPPEDYKQPGGVLDPPQVSHVVTVVPTITPPRPGVVASITLTDAQRQQFMDMTGLTTENLAELESENSVAYASLINKFLRG